MPRVSLCAGVILLAWIGWAAGQRPDVIATSVPPRPPVPPPAAPPPRLPVFAGIPVAPTTPAGLGLSVTLLGPPTLVAGQVARYEIQVRNGGSVPLYQVRIEQELPAGASLVRSEPRAQAVGNMQVWTVDRFDGGASVRLALEFQPASDNSGQSSPRLTFATTRSEPQALVLSATGPERVMLGQPVNFQIRLTNAGATTIRHILLRDPLPGGLQSPLGAIVETKIESLAPGETQVLPPLPTMAVRAGDCVNEIVATADGGLQASTRASVLVVEGSP